MREIGKMLQVTGLSIPPLIIVAQLADAIKSSQMLMMLVGCVCLFGIGRIVEGYSQ